MKKPLIIIRTDGNNLIGMGHIYRSITLAQEFKKFNAEICFIIGNNSSIFSKLQKYGKCYISNNLETKEIQIIQKLNPDIIIIDLLKKFFPFSKNYFLQIHSIGKLVTIDFIGNENKYSDLTINYLFKPKIHSFDNAYFGLKYAIIRKQFLRFRKNFYIKKNVKSILILQGGADTHGFSLKIIKALSKIDKNIAITLVAGPAFLEWKKLLKLKKYFKNLKILHNISNMPKEMIKHDLAISAAGNSLLELLFLGIPTIIVCAERHEVDFAKYIHSQKLAIFLGFGHDLSQKKILIFTQSVILNYDLRKTLYSNSRKRIDIKGISRVTTLIYNLINSNGKHESF